MEASQQRWGSANSFPERLKAVYSHAGPVYSALYSVRWMVRRLSDWMDRRLVQIEQNRAIIQPWAVSSHRFTSAELGNLYNQWDWSKGGEEWTKSPEWKNRVISDFLVPNIPPGGTVIEIGPGGGRWTDVLRKRAAKLYVVDVAVRALETCKERFADSTNIEYVLGDGHTIPLPDGTVDAVWSFDVFVHINPLDARRYFEEFRRLLKPGGRAVIHHPGAPPKGAAVRPGGRSDLTDVMVTRFVKEFGFDLVLQTQELVDEKNKGDVLTVFSKP